MFDTMDPRPAEAPSEQKNKLARTLIVVAVCVVLAIGLLGIGAAIVIPGLMRARMSGNEASAIGSMRAISSAQAAYSAVCAAGFYAPTLEALGLPPRDATDGRGFVSSDLVGPGPVVKSGYEIRLSAVPAPDSPESCNGVPAGKGARAWIATATPQPNLGSRHFAVTTAGAVWESPQPIAFGADNLPLPPAQPLQ